jgi:hypothetical protein
MPTLRVELTADLIADLIALGVRHSAAGCPVALAVARLFPAALRVTVVPVRPAGWVCRVYGPGKRFRSGVLPAAAAKWVAAYTDGAVGMEPIAFDLELGG